MSKLACTFAFLVFLFSLSLSVGTVSVTADNANFVVEPQKEHVITLNLQETDSVSGSVSVVSTDDTGIDFYVVDPQNKTILAYGSVSHKSFSFTAPTTGNYQLHFDNSVSSAVSKTVTLNYNTIHYIMGMPQEQFLFLIIAAAALIGVLLYVVLLPK